MHYWFHYCWVLCFVFVTATGTLLAGWWVCLLSVVLLLSLLPKKSINVVERFVNGGKFASTTGACSLVGAVSRAMTAIPIASTFTFPR
jgi:hypothetical protein